MAIQDLQLLQERLPYTFREVRWLQLALTHPSTAFGREEDQQHNQRLEFLGDAVLSLVLTRELFERFPEFGEGPLTKARAQLANRQSLVSRARLLDLGQHLLLSHGEEASGGRERPSALADAFEAVVGAIFMDGGLEAARAFVLRCFQDEWGGFAALPRQENPKGELQELLQARSPAAPRYLTTAVTGPEHDRWFECAVRYQGEELGRGQGKSKKAAESQAAFVALAHLRAKKQRPPADQPVPTFQPGDTASGADASSSGRSAGLEKEPDKPLPPAPETP